MSIGLNYNTDRSEQVYGWGLRAPGVSAYAYEESDSRVRRAAQNTGSHEALLDNGTDDSLASCPATAGSELAGSPVYQQGAELVRELTQNLTRLSTERLPDGNPFAGENKDPAVDPNSPSFSAKAWMQTVLQIRSRDPKAHPMRTAGVSFRNLCAMGYSKGADYQKTVSTVILQGFDMIRHLIGKKGPQVKILSSFDGLVEAGELCVVLGPPGSGCSTFLKTIAGETHGFDVSGDFNYQGISAAMMQKNFRGEAIYTAEQDVHFPQLTVHQTLSFAAEARAPREPPAGISKREYANYMADVVMAVFGIHHTRDTRVGNEFVRGVSGGERKRVTISEAALSAAPLQCWDNSTRGLDAANAVEFVKNLRLSTELTGATAFIAIYQSPQAAYDLFDKALVLYEGRSIFFGKAIAAKKFFVDMGFFCPERQTTPDFLTSLTSPKERRAREGFENKVPRTPDEFEARWKASQEYKRLINDIEAYNEKYAIGGEALQKFEESRKIQQAKGQSVKSPYTLSYYQQTKLCLRRGFWRLKADPSLTLSELIGNSSMALIVSSIFYNLQPTTSSFFQRGALIFFAVLLNAFGSALEILTLYAQRPIVEKHSRYALYHPSAESFASMLTDIPYKISNAILFNCILYFMTNLNRHAGNFFFYLFVSFSLTLTMSMLFRTIASASRTLSQAMVPASILILAIVIYAGFTLPINYMLGWSRWINYLNPVAYGFESLMVNEFWGRVFRCTAFTPSGPGYDQLGGDNRVCQSAGTIPGTDFVSGGDYVALTYQYYHSHKWRNIGIIYGFMLFLLGTYLIASEYISSKKSKGEILVFRRGHEPLAIKQARQAKGDGENGGTMHLSDAISKEGQDQGISPVIQRQTAVFHWQDVCYDIKVKGGERRLLDHVDGWIKPGQLTALMGASGAGKTTLLDVLASRVTMGVVSGQMLIDGKLRDSSFQRKTGYVQQQDLHLETATVREALVFSAVLRQPAHVPKTEKLAYVEEVIKILDMEPYADAVIGILGEGLNVEQRKRLTIGVEMAAKPELLFFLDEPTSGLDSQTSWSILDLLEKLTIYGQAILCTIHQPSAMLFSRFHRLLLLEMGGRTVYFGRIGENSHVLTEYFEKNGSGPCPSNANPAEWMLQVIGAAPGSHTEIDWHETWKNSDEFREVRQHLADLQRDRPKEHEKQQSEQDKQSYNKEFAAPFTMALREVTKRVFQQTWRTPSYIYSKAVLCVLVALFIGFSFFDQPLSSQGLQNQMFAFFLVLTVFGQMVQQIMPHFVRQRELYEARERPSKTYSWQVFMLSNIVSELPYDVLMGTLIFFCWYYPIGMYHNASYTDTVNSRGVLMWAYIVQFMLFTSTFTHLVIAAIPTAETAGNIANILFSLTLLFCGVIATPATFPGFWIFMYRVSPFTYMVAGILATGLANAPVTCSDLELVVVQPPDTLTCGQYLDPYANAAGARLFNPSATANCQLCPLASTNGFLGTIDARYDLRFRNFGLIWAYIVFNVAGAFLLYWLGRVPKKSGRTKQERRPNKTPQLEKTEKTV